MLLFWVMLHVLLHQRITDALVPVVTAQLGKPVTLTCDLNKVFQSMDWLHWYKQTTGDTLKLISVLQKNANPIYGTGFSSINFNSTYDNKMFNLTILRTAKEDKGMYHCVHMNRFESIWNGSYLSLEGNTETTSSYRVVQQPAVLDPSRPAESDTLQCSLLSQPEEKTCSGEPSVFWLRTKLGKSVPDLIFTDGKTPENLATCGEILLGDGTRVEIAHSLSGMSLVITMICLVISVLLNIGLICCQTHRRSLKNRERSSSQTQHNHTRQPDDFTEEGEHLTYAALHFSTGTTNKRELKTKESVYSNVRLSHLENTS
ncbi:uncharacterized protein LOC119791497 isoform X2 [Cyprinodon tularosa]|uniref:uncharacterized protein LOC119791497 isoform X2 n=1 Tax=Cyprinodon tularosa TaxID=77115 RepID=UPI0018E25D02|nr:uncharacterized protein LOC119791497 isoform X2 [Cyprinodon tularosa]